MVLCVGDSLTFGSIGYSYIKYLDKKFIAINKGVNGDTTRGAYKRLQHYLDSPIFNKVETYIIEIGTNDILLPFLATVSNALRHEMEPKIQSKKCILNDKVFQNEYEKFIILLKEHNKKIILVGMPILQLNNFPNYIVRRRNSIIKNLAKKYNVPYVDVYKRQKEALSSYPVTYSWKNKQKRRFLEELIMLIAPFTKEWFSIARRLELTVDGVHYNKSSAKRVAKSINMALITYNMRYN